MFKFQISMAEKECYFVKNVGGVVEDFPSITPI